MSYQKNAMPVRTPDGIIILRSESEKAGNILYKMKIPYPRKVLNSVPT